MADVVKQSENSGFFEDQVGGAANILLLKNGHIAKPTKAGEMVFYEHMPSALLKVTPICCYTIKEWVETKMPHSCEMCHIDMEELSALVKTNGNEKSDSLRPRKIGSSFILMVNLTKNLNKPAILDLKVGTRQHADNAPVEKMKKRIARCANSTSMELGIRLCGIKFDNFGTTVKFDRHQGRDLSSIELKKLLKDFFKSTLSAPQIKKKILDIKDVLAGLDGVRFFGSSILIIAEPTSRRTEVKIVDFANGSLPGILGDNTHSGPDDGAILGLNTILSLLE